MFYIQNPNDPDDENEHFKQPYITIEKMWKISITALPLRK